MRAGIVDSLKGFRPLLPITVLAVLFAILLGGCAESSPQAGVPKVEQSEEEAIATPTETAAVTAVEAISKGPNTYTFSVTVESPDTGCDRYANWWEVVTEEGELLHRRTLAHSHVDEQPFTRSSGPVKVAPDQPVIVRVHLHPQGYSAQAVKGTASGGWMPATLPSDFASELAEADAQSLGCAF